MRIELLEKVVFFFAILAILLVAGMVAFFSFVLPRESGISKEEEVATIAVDDWLRNAQATAQGRTIGPQVIDGPSMGNPVKPSGGSPAGGGPARPSAPPEPGKVDPYFDAAGQIPPAEQVAGIPWLRKQEGVTYMRPEPVPEIVYQRYQGFNEAWSAAQEGGGEFVQGRYQINWVNEQSLLYSKAGLRPGDQVISVNGHPIGQSFSAGKALYDQLKGERRFAVKVRRNGQDVVLSFFVN